jgi:phospholipid-binding lipoprotein MlaA
VRESLGGVFRNLGAPVRIVNALLQLKLQRAVDELFLCIANTTFGVGGIFKLDTGILEQTDGEDFGQTLGHYGTPPGFYLVLPVLGPSNARDVVGRVADSLTHPLPSPYYVKLQQLEVAGAQAVETVNTLSLDKDTYEAIKKDELDPYLFVRSAYMQNRAARIDK